MKKRLFLLIAASLLAALALPAGAYAQLARNTNQSRRLGSVLVGGSGNLIVSNTQTAFIGGGLNNTASGSNSVVSGGRRNGAQDENAVVSGGEGNVASGSHSAVGGGYNNSASALLATVSGGRENTASGAASTVGGGEYNTASGNFATVPGGSRCTASHGGSFVWSGSFDIPTVSTNAFSFTVRAPGGARFLSTTNTNSFVGVILPNAATAWASLSDSNSKTDFASIKPREILSKVASLPVTAWHYKHDPKRLYIGPMAQDFHAAFGLGSDDKTISTLDSDGVMYAAIQGLVEELKDRDAKIGELEAKSAEIDALKAKLGAMEERLNSLPPAP